MLSMFGIDHQENQTNIGNIQTQIIGLQESLLGSLLILLMLFGQVLTGFGPAITSHLTCPLSASWNPT